MPEQYGPVSIWLVISTPLKKISQLGWLLPVYGKIYNVPNHQPGMVISWSMTFKRLYTLGEDPNLKICATLWGSGMVTPRSNKTCCLLGSSRFPDVLSYTRPSPSLKCKILLKTWDIDLCKPLFILSVPKARMITDLPVAGEICCPPINGRADTGHGWEPEMHSVTCVANSCCWWWPWCDDEEDKEEQRRPLDDQDIYIIYIYTSTYLQKSVWKDIDDKPWNLGVPQCTHFQANPYIKIVSKTTVVLNQCPSTMDLDVILQLLLNQQLSASRGDPSNGNAATPRRSV